MFTCYRYIRATITIKFTMSTWSTRMLSSLRGIRSRQIEECDLAAVADLLTRGFPNRSRQFWLHALDQLMRRVPPRDLPKYGYLLETNGAIVGAILLICSAMRSGDAPAPRCNLSSWYVEPQYRAYASLLISHALRHKDVTYLNVSAAPHTWPIIEAQGFSRYSDGLFISVPALTRRTDAAKAQMKAKVFDASERPAVAFDPFDEQVLAQHAEHGCISLWCATAEGAYPFVFRPRLVRGFIPCAQLIYCRDIADFARFAGPVGRYLARRGRLVTIADSNGPLPGLVGIFRRGSKPKYFKGPTRPRLGDLAYTEYAILGV
jgi:hypothetical protein